MAREYDVIDKKLADFVCGQPVFFVATAPLSEDGHVNLSPKGLDSFAVLDERRVAYLDLTGSGVETIAHLRENGRIVVMFCAFEGSPRIVRFHGKGRAVLKDDPDFAELAAHFKPFLSARSVIVIDVTRISDSCGYGVPLMKFERERDQLPKWAERKGPEGVVEYQQTKNATSLDGLPGVI